MARMSRPSHVSPPPANHQQARPSMPGMPGMPARPMEELTTQIVPLPGGGPSSSRSRRPRGPLAFMRTLRWRLTLTYAALFAVLLVVLGLVLNGIIGRVLYAEDLQSFRTDMVDTVSTNHGHFDLAVT